MGMFQTSSPWGPMWKEHSFVSFKMELELQAMKVELLQSLIAKHAFFDHHYEVNNGC